MGISEQLNLGMARMAQECNAIRIERGPLASLATTNKTSIVLAINELMTRIVTSVGVVIDDENASTTATWSSAKIAEMFGAIEAGGQIDDEATGTGTTWSSARISQAITDNTPASEIDDEATGTGTTWSSAKIAEIIASLPASVVIDDSLPASDKVWSSLKVAQQIALVTKESIGLDQVENKSSATIRGEISSANVTNALGYTPVSSVSFPVSNAGGVVGQAASLVVTGPKTTVSAVGPVITINVDATNKADIGLALADNTPDASKPVSTAQAAADTVVLNSAKSYAEGLVVGLWDDRGNYDASTNLFPSAGGSGAAGAVIKGDIWTVNVPGTLGGVAVVPRQTVRAMTDAPGQTSENWALSTANTTLTQSITSGAVGVAPSSDAVYDALTAKLDATALPSGVRGAVLTGLSLATNAVISATDSVLSAFGKLQKQLTDLISAAATKTGVETLTNKTLTSPVISGGTITTPIIVGATITNFTESGVSPAAGATFTVDLANGTDIEYTINANATITLPAPVAGKSYTILINYLGAYTPTFVPASGTLRPFSGAIWPTPTSVNGKADLYVFKCNRAGTATFVQDGGRNG